MERYTYFDGGKWRLKISDTEYSGGVVDRLAAYEDTGLEPEEMEQIKQAAAHMMFEDVAQFVRYTLNNFDELQKYKALGDYNRLRELAQAHKENRVLPEGSGWFVTCSGKKLTVVMDIEAALRREQDG